MALTHAPGPLTLRDLDHGLDVEDHSTLTAALNRTRHPLWRHRAWLISDRDGTDIVRRRR